MTRNNPSTSIDAYKSLQPDQIREVYKKILSALEVLGQASTEQIAEYLTMEHARVHKRVSEMQGLQMIYRPGHRVPTKSGRTAFVWCLCKAGEKVEKKTESQKSLPGKSIVDHSRELIKKQQSLF